MKNSENIEEKVTNSAVPEMMATPAEELPTKLNPRERSDPMQLFHKITDKIRKLFKQRRTDFTDSQLGALDAAVQEILTAKPNTIAIVPLAPGGGKSTLIEAVLEVFSEVFTRMYTPLAQCLGGVIVVVQKSDEGHRLVDLCNKAAGCEVATIVESPNDANLRRGGCLNGTASTYAECLKRDCPDYTRCPLVKAASRGNDTPIVVVLHARFERYIDNMEAFVPWTDKEGNTHRRTLLLIDEQPQFFGEVTLSTAAINEAENELDKARPSYHPRDSAWKKSLKYLLCQSLTIPFNKTKMRGSYGVLEQGADGMPLGFSRDDLTEFLDKLEGYATNTQAELIARTLLDGEPAYYTVGGSESIFVPFLRTMDVKSGLATFIFSGTATLAPELKTLPGVRFLDDIADETFERLRIHAQYGGGLSGSREQLKHGEGKYIAQAWVESVLTEAMETHGKVLLVSYKAVAEELWAQLADYHDLLIPYQAETGEALPMLPYFGGLHGSNKYLGATAVICLGLPRYQPGTYLSHALALDECGEVTEAIRTALAADPHARLNEIEAIANIESVELANDLVQLIYRSKLRNHGDTTAIDIYLLQPPQGVLDYLKEYFHGCNVQIVKELPESVEAAITEARLFQGKQTHAGKVMAYLLTHADEEVITPADIREGTGLNPDQYHEACKNRRVKEYLTRYYKTEGTGRHAKYIRIHEVDNDLVA